VQHNQLAVLFTIVLTSALTYGAEAGQVRAKPLPRLKVSENKRFLVTEAGKPFFYLADTGWELFHRLDRDDAEHYLENRAKKGLNVIQAVVLAEMSGMTATNSYGQLPLVDGDPLKPNEEYFKAGFGKCCDAYDFHVYETAEDVRRSIKEYQTLMKKYKCEKPIWSTEIGLNSQGLTRQHISGDMIRKFAYFFACGGVNIGWFDYLYPDGDGKALGTSGDSHSTPTYPLPWARVNLTRHNGGSNYCFADGHAKWLKPSSPGMYTLAAGD